MKDKYIKYLEIWDLLAEAQSLMNTLSREVQAQYDLVPQELRVMLELDRVSSMNISELSKAINRDFGNVSRTCSALVERGLLSRQRADWDHRVILMALTEKGKDKLKVFYQYSLSLMQSNMLENNKSKYEAMMTGMRLFLSFIAERMEELNDKSR